MSEIPTRKNATEILIKPSAAWLSFDWQGLIAYRDLLQQLVLRDFTAKYKQTILGPAWFLLNPLLTTLTFTLVFNRVIGVPTDGVPPILFYLCGMLGWSYFSAVLSATGNSLAGSAHLFSKVYFPRLIPPFALTISNLLALAIQLITFIVFFIYFKFFITSINLPNPSLLWLIFPLLVIQMGLLSVGTGLLLSTLTAKYRDLAQIQGFLVQLWLYATPVIYPISKVPEKWQWIAHLNPMTAIVESTRRIFLGVGTVSPLQYGISILSSIFIFLLGVFCYQRAARTFVDTV